MAKKTKSERGTRSWLSFFSFVAVLLLGLALAISVTIGAVISEFKTIADIIQKIAIAIALIVPLFYSYYEARKHKTVWLVLWIIAIILIVVFYILAIVL